MRSAASREEAMQVACVSSYSAGVANTKKMELLKIILVALVCWVASTVTASTTPTIPIPDYCNIRNGMDSTDCNRLAADWTSGRCRFFNVDNWSPPVLWVGFRCPGSPVPDGGCKVGCPVNDDP